MTALPTDLSFLFARLTHPSGMVRERTCVAIAQLLSHPKWQASIRQHLQSWMGSQRLESVPIFALLIWIRARIENPETTLPSLEEMLATFPCPSVVSWLLLRELYGPNVPRPDWCTMFSSDVPPDFQADPFFQRYVRNFLPPVYMDTAESVTQRTWSSFVKQWAWEWHQLLTAMGIEPDARVLDFTGRLDSEHYIVVDYNLSEVYRSTYLRTLAWAIGHGVITQGDAELLAAKCCPLDIAIWQTDPGAPPGWWPHIPSSMGEIDTSAAHIMQQLQLLWEGATSGDDEWVMAEASGLVRGGTLPYNLEVYGLFQHCTGPVAPDLKEVIEWCRWRCIQPISYETLLRSTGSLHSVHPSETQQRFGDWVIVPASAKIHTVTVPRWQWWRAYRDIWAPAAFLGDSPLELQVTDIEIVVKDGKNVIARWTDWTDGLREQQLANLPPATGQCLLVKRDLINSFSASSRSRFCWVWRMTGYHRQHDYQEFETLSFEGQLGASNVIWV